MTRKTDDPRKGIGKEIENGAGREIEKEVEKEVEQEARNEAREKEENALPNLSNIEVLAFVGAAGTGKSQRASQVARQYGIDFVIDDGLLVSKGQIMAGKSAKSEQNLVRAIRRALFEYPPHRLEVVAFLASHAPCKVMVIATSESMMMKIVGKLGLPPPQKVIDITEVASREEIDNALKERREKNSTWCPSPAPRSRGISRANSSVS
ncbi:MAG: hypothetical protein LBO68_02745 [Synergistaceae bacterium]|jgi:hypothetical protein|nr:hypothetical protein [Synergistaceae bacterium]